MPAEHIATLGDSSQLSTLIKGEYLKGHAFPRVAFVGRSNVGKSSLINVLLGTRLAQVSNTPGKTKAIYFYLDRQLGIIVADLPGYGFARVPVSERERWSKFIQGYITGDGRLTRIFSLLDARVGPTPIDLQAIDFLQSLGLELVFVMTKTDGLKNQKARAARRKEVEALLAPYAHVKTLWVSAHEKQGLKDLKALLGEASKETAEPTEGDSHGT